MPLERGVVAAALTFKGFKSIEGDHTFFIYYSQAGKKSTVRTKTSHGSGYKDIADHLVSQMAKQCKLTTKEFKDLVDCPLSRQEYEAKLIGRGFVDLPEQIGPNKSTGRTR
jgi:hypothetical protein